MDEFSYEELQTLRVLMAEEINSVAVWAALPDEHSRGGSEERLKFLENLLAKIDLELLHRRQNER